MADAKKLLLILDLIADGDFRLTVHARMRMKERGVQSVDITSVARTHDKATWQADGKLQIIGTDTSGDSLTVIAAYESGVLIITVF
jgi:hypothetical protein